MATRQIAMRLPDELIAQVDEFAKVLRKANPGLVISRSDAMRLLIHRALEPSDPVKRKPRP